jgi:salicylate hydroxylase
VSARPHIAVAGAGIAGLAAALSLAQHGFEVTLLEQARELGEVGAGVQLGPNATAALFGLGLRDELEALASHTSGKLIRLWDSGQTWKLFDLGAEAIERYGFPYLTMYRPDLQSVLADAARRSPRIRLRLGARFVGCEQSVTGVNIELEGGERIEAGLLVGADGVHSAVRRHLFGPDAPRFSGCMAWRGVIPSERLPEHLRQPVAVNWVGSGGHVVHYPLRGGRLVNFVGILERDDWQLESWTQVGSREECLQDFEGWHPDVAAMIQAIDMPYKWALMVREPMSGWIMGRALLIGDACHPTLPFLAQGAAMAIEDGVVLGRVLGRASEAPHLDLTAALRRFEALRLERTSRMVRGSAANAERFHNPALASASGAAAYVDREWREEAVRERYDWLFRYDAHRVEIGEARS